MAATPETETFDGVAVRTELRYEDTAPSSASGPQRNVWTNEPIDTTTLTTMVATAIGNESPLDDKDDANQLVTADCASGYLIPNTNFGNLLQTTDTPLTDSFISSDDEYTQKLDRTNANDVDNDGSLDDPADITVTAMINENAILSMNEVATASIPGLDSEIARSMRHTESGDSGIGTAENTSTDHTPETETNNLVIATTADNQVTVSVGCSSGHIDHQEPTSKKSSQSVRQHTENVSVSVGRPAIVPIGSQLHHHHHYHHHHHHTHNANAQPPQQTQQPKSPYFPSGLRNEKKNCQRKHHQSHSGYHSSAGVSSNASRTGSHSASAGNESAATRYRRRLHCTSYRGHHHSSVADEKISISSTSTIYSDGAAQDVALAHRTSGRMKFK